MWPNVIRHLSLRKLTITAGAVTMAKGEESHKKAKKAKKATVQKCTFYSHSRLAEFTSSIIGSFAKIVTSICFRN